MKIGQAARRSGLEPSAIRFYESQGVLPAPKRTAAGYREYDQPSVELLRFVRRLRSLELPLDDIREIVALRIRGEAPCSQVRDALRREAESIDARIAELERLRDELAGLEEAAASLVDRWPGPCVCHVIEGGTVS